jgi:hypothetical protein
MKTTKELIIADITAKVEAKLASQKVNLSLVDDLKTLKSVFDNKITPLYKEISKDKSVLRDKGLKASSLLISTVQEIEQDLILTEKSAKDLGVDINIIKEYSSLKSLLKITPDMEKVFKSVQ